MVCDLICEVDSPRSADSGLWFAAFCGPSLRSELNATVRCAVRGER